MMNPAPTPAAERLADAKRQLRQVEQQIEAAVEERRDVLREGSASAPAAVTADREVADLKSLRGRLADQVDLLPAVVMREESEANWPPTSALARQKLEEMRERLARLRAKRPVDRSAVDDADIGWLASRVGALGKHIELLQIFEVNA